MVSLKLSQPQAVYFALLHTSCLPLWQLMGTSPYQPYTRIHGMQFQLQFSPPAIVAYLMTRRPHLSFGNGKVAGLVGVQIITGTADYNIKHKVGSTLFDALVEAVCKPECLRTLRKLGYSSLVIQLGKGNFIPDKSAGEAENIDIEHFSYKPNVAEYLNSANLVISHAGSGSIFETLRARRPLVVVVNALLMDNHQSELADELAERKYLYTSSPETLVDTLRTMKLEILVPYPSSEPSALVKSLDRFLGFTPSMESVSDHNELD